MANAIPGDGTLVAVKISASFVTIGEVISCEPPDIKVSKKDLSTLVGTSKKYRPGRPDYGKAKIKFHYDPNDSTHQHLRTAASGPTQTLDEFKVTYVDGLTTPSNLDFKGFVETWKESGIEEDGTLTAEVEIQVTDTYTATAGS